MEQELKEYYDGMEELFATKGWKDHIEDLQGIQETYRKNAETDCNSNDEWQFRRGQLDILKYILGFESIIKEARIELESAADEVSKDYN